MRKYLRTYEERMKMKTKDAFDRGKISGYIDGYSDACQGKPKNVTESDILFMLGFGRSITTFEAFKHVGEKTEMAQAVGTDPTRTEADEAI